MIKFCLLILFLGVTLLITSYVWVKKPNDAIYYVSLNKAILLGQYDGNVTVQELKKHGDFGLGSEEKLASEMVLLDGEVYSIPTDGKATKMPYEAKIPFAAVKFFRADKKVKAKNLKEFKELETFLDSVLVNNTFSAIKIKGKFSSIEYRTFYKQEKPYLTTEDVEVKKFKKENIQGTMVGFYTPKSAEVLNSPQFHFHFIDEGKTTGGHVLECVPSEVEIEIDYATELHINLASPELLKNIDLNTNY